MKAGIFVSSLFASVLGDYRVATIFDQDTTQNPDLGDPCASQDLNQMVCLDDMASHFGRTLFDMDLDGIPPKNWELASTTDFFLTTRNNTDICGWYSDDCLYDPRTDNDTALVQVVPDIKNVSLGLNPVGECIVNMYIGDYPYLVKGQSKGMKYTIANRSTWNPQQCQKSCILEENCVLWTFVFNKKLMQDPSVNCFLQSQLALDSLYKEPGTSPNSDCGFGTSDNSAFQVCSYHKDTKICAINTGYAVSGMAVCDPTNTPTTNWMQYNSVCSPYTPTTTSTSTNHQSGVTTKILLTSITSLIISLITILI